MRAIGGFFELEIPEGREYHQEAIGVNSGRNALGYILSGKKYRKLYIPYYICGEIVTLLNKTGMSYEFYSINIDFEPVFDFVKVQKDEAFLYINYFGLKDKFVSILSENKELNLIIDNAQSFFSRPLKGIDTFYSARKFFGVPDGAYLYTHSNLDNEIAETVSFDRMQHLVQRIDDSAESAYPFFRESEISIGSFPIGRMSKLTRKLLGAIDYGFVAGKRKENFQYLHQSLDKSNKLDLSLELDSIPMIYPYYDSKGGLRELLMKKKIYTAMYWPDVLDRSNDTSIERMFALNLVCLPIDHRYGKQEMDLIINTVINA